jgi:hypothetical protein
LKQIADTLRIILILALCAVVSAHAATRYVSHTGSNTFPYTTWETAANTIEAANIATIPGDTMFIDTGSYQLAQTIVLPSKITLRGKGMDSTTILGDSTIIDMFKPGDSTFVEDIYFRGNNSYRGLSKYRYEGFWSWWVTRCKFTNFHMGPITCSEAERVDVSHCWLGGWGDPGAIAVADRGKATITNCTFYAPNFAYPICSFSGNRTGHEIFDSNIVVGGGLIGISGFEGELKYNLFYGESYMSQSVYGGVAMEVAFNSFYMDIPWHFSYADILTINSRALDHAYIYNNIFAGMNPRVIFDFNIPDSSDIRITYNCFYSTYPMTRSHIGNTNGTGTIDSVYGNVYADPMFVDPDNGDLRLQKGSPCIDAGAPWILDVDGTRSDIGAFGGPGGSFYVYQDFPPKTPAKMDVFWFGSDRVVVDWERNSESDFTHYVLFRTTDPSAPLDSNSVLAYLDRLARPINVGPERPGIGFGTEGKHVDPYQYIPIYDVDNLRLVYHTDRFPIDTTDSYYTLVAVDSAGLKSPPVTVSVGAGLAPAQHTGDHEGRPYETDVTPQDGMTYELEQNYPNPFNATTALIYNLPNIGAQPAPVRLAVYNLLGQQIKSLIDEKQQPGRHTVYWDGTNQQGQPVASGVYFYRLEVSGVEFVKSGKMILMK